MALGHLDELQKAKKYPIRWSLYTGFTVLVSHCTNEHLSVTSLDIHVQYIPRNMHTVLLCFALLWLCNRS